MRLPSLLWIIFFILSIFVSSVFALDPEASFATSLRYAGCLLFYMIVYSFINTNKDISEIFIISIILCAIIFIVGYFLLSTASFRYFDVVNIDPNLGFYASAIEKSNTKRDFLVWNANTIAYFSVYMLLMGVYFLFSDQNKNGFFVRFKLHYLTIGLFGFFLIKTLSRGGVIALVIPLLFLSFYLQFKHIRKHAIIIFFIVVIMVAISFPYLKLIEERFLRGLIGIFGYSFFDYDIPGDHSIMRIDQIYEVFSIIQSRPFLGIGFLTTEEMWKYINLFSYESLSINHFYYINIMMYVGIIGFTFYMLIIFTVFAKLLKTVNLLKRNRDRKYLEGSIILAFFIAVLVKGLFSPLTYDIWFVLGMSAAYIRITEANLRATRFARHVSHLNRGVLVP